MKKQNVSLLLCAALLAAGGCTAPQAGTGSQEQRSYLVYYSALSNEEGESAVEGERRILEEEEEPIPGLMEMLLEQPQSRDLTTPFPSGLQLLGWQLKDNVLYLNLSEQYYSLSGINLTLADTCLTLTLCQLEGVDSVYVMVEGHELPYRAIQQLSVEDVLLAGSADEPMSLNVDLWYLRQGEQSLGVERRQIIKDVDQTVIEAVLSVWAEGPEQAGLKACLPEGSQILSAELEDSVCVVDLSPEFIQGLPANEETAALMVYAMVNTLCELDGVEAVQIYIDGQPAPAVGSLPLDRALIPDAALGAEG